jgi:hypothetical protein
VLDQHLKQSSRRRNVSPQERPCIFEPGFQFALEPSLIEVGDVPRPRESFQVRDQGAFPRFFIGEPLEQRTLFSSIGDGIDQILQLSLY